MLLCEHAPQIESIPFNLMYNGPCTVEITCRPGSAHLAQRCSGLKVFRHTAHLAEQRVYVLIMYAGAAKCRTAYSAGSESEQCWQSALFRPYACMAIPFGIPSARPDLTSPGYVPSMTPPARLRLAGYNAQQQLSYISPHASSALALDTLGCRKTSAGHKKCSS